MRRENLTAHQAAHLCRHSAFSAAVRHRWALSLVQLEVLQRSHLRRMLDRSAWQVPPGSNSQPKYISNEALAAACPGVPTIEQQLRLSRNPVPPTTIAA